MSGADPITGAAELLSELWALLVLKVGLFNKDRRQTGKQIWARFTKQEKNIQNTKHTL